jgi:hypothetical protein
VAPTFLSWPNAQVSWVPKKKYLTHRVTNREHPTSVPVVTKPTVTSMSNTLTTSSKGWGISVSLHRVSIDSLWCTPRVNAVFTWIMSIELKPRRFANEDRRASNLVARQNHTI